MAVTPLGDERLRQLLDGSLRVIVTNRAPRENDALIVAVLLAVHGADGSVALRAVQDLELMSGESDVLDEDRPGAAAVIGVEVLVRVRAQRLLHGYTKLETSSTAPIARIEIGIAGHDGDLGPGESAIDDAPALAVFARVDGDGAS